MKINADNLPLVLVATAAKAAGFDMQENNGTFHWVRERHISKDDYTRLITAIKHVGKEIHKQRESNVVELRPGIREIS